MREREMEEEDKTQHLYESMELLGARLRSGLEAPVFLRRAKLAS